MRKFYILVIFSIFPLFAIYAQPASSTLNRPKLVVGIVVDQMRWDFLYRYYDRYGEGGFKRLLQEGFSCENTYINYLPSYTAVGHSCIFTGSVPAINGITGNNWTEQLTGAHVYCTDDSTVQSVGVNASADGKMSPRNLLVTTITDELRIATNYQSRVVGVSLKDRASILPAGHAANAAYWLDDQSGNFITSTYYMNKLPDAIEKFNREKNIEKYMSKDWTTLYPIETYTESDSDAKPYEGNIPGESSPVFPHALKSDYAKDPGVIRCTPFGNTVTFDFAKVVLDTYKLGMGPATDFLTINCASTDYVGHIFGPNSIEIEDVYLRLDQELASFFSELDAKLGKGQYLVFVTADHGAAHANGYAKENKIPSEYFMSSNLLTALNELIQQKFAITGTVRSGENYQINFNLEKIAAANGDLAAIKKTAIDFLRKEPGVSFVVDLDEITGASVPEPLRTMILNGYNYKRSGQIQVIFQPGWLESSMKTGTTHGTWNPDDTHIPLVFMGWNIHPGATTRVVHMTDIAPTLASLLHIQTPSGNIGVPVADLFTK